MCIFLFFFSPSESNHKESGNQANFSDMLSGDWHSEVHMGSNENKVGLGRRRTSRFGGKIEQIRQWKVSKVLGRQVVIKEIKRKVWL